MLPETVLDLCGINGLACIRSSDGEAFFGFDAATSLLTLILQNQVMGCRRGC